MREIKFRVWDMQCNTMFEAFEIHQTLREDNIEEDGKLVEAALWSKDAMFLQYTGLKDKNNKEIYEGDIVECSMSFDGGTLPHTGEIIYLKQFGAFATKNLGGETLLHNHLLNTFEIKGNVYENLDLVEKLKC